MTPAHPVATPGRRITGAILVATLVWLASPAAGKAGKQSGRPGTMDLLAGPGFCQGSSARDDSTAVVLSLAVTPAQAVYAETGPPAEGRLIRVGADGTVSFVSTGDPRPAGQGASRLASDVNDAIFFTTPTKVMRIDPLGSATRVAGSFAGRQGEGADAGDGGPAANSLLHDAISVAADAQGNVFIADQQSDGSVRIRFVNRSQAPVAFYQGTPGAMTVPPGRIDTVAGVPGPSPSGDGAPSRKAVLKGPVALASGTGRLFVASRLVNGAAGIREINFEKNPLSQSGRTIAPGSIDLVAAGPGAQGPLGATFKSISGMALDPKGSLLVADTERNQVIRMSADGSFTLFAGGDGNQSRVAGFNGNDRPATGAQMDHPFDVKTGPGGRTYVSDQLNHQVRVIDPSGGIRVIAGSGGASQVSCLPGPSGRPLDSPRPGDPISVAEGERGEIFFLNYQSGQVKKVDGSGVVSTVAGGPSRAGSIGDGGRPELATFNLPVALAYLGGKGLYVLDSGNARLRFINLSSDKQTVNGVAVKAGTVATIAGTGKIGGDGDGGRGVSGRIDPVHPLAVITGTAGVGPSQPLEFNIEIPSGSVAVDAQGDVFFTDYGNQRVREVDTKGILSSYAGAGAQDARASCCRQPLSLALDAAGNLYVADGGTEASGLKSHPMIWLINRGPDLISVRGVQIRSQAASPIAGDGTLGLPADGETAGRTPLLFPTSLAPGPQSSLYVGMGGFVAKIDTYGVLRLIAGNGVGSFNGTGLKGQLTGLGNVSGLVLDRCGNLLIADPGTDAVWRLNQAEPCSEASAPSPHRGGLGKVAAAALAGALGLALAVWLMRQRSRHA